MPISHSLALGRSYLPGRVKNVAMFISQTAGAIGQNPDVAVEIHLAATHKLLSIFNAPVELREALRALVDESCRARDRSVQ